MSKKIVYAVKHPGELGAGLYPYYDTITIVVESADPGGGYKDFENYMRQCLAEWFDGADVTERKNSSVD